MKHMEDDKTVDVTITRRFSVSPEQIFNAWVDEQTLGTWMFGPNVRDETIVHLYSDAKVGGKFSFLVQRGENQIDHVGIYRVIERPRRLVFTWGVVGDSENESEVHIDIVPLDAGCEVRLTHVMDQKWAEYKSQTGIAWAKMLMALAKTLESNRR